MADLSRYRSSTTTTTKSKKKKTKPKGFNVLSSSSDEDEHQQTIARNQQKEKVPVLEKQPKFTPVSKDVSSEGEDQSPPRRARRESSEETSPRKRRRGSEDLSPPRRQRNEEPIRQQEEKHDLSPPRRRLRSPTKSDASPRKRSRGDTSSKARQDEDLSPPRRKRERSDSPEVRRRPNIDTDLSPPRRKSSYSTVDHAKLSQGNAATIHRDQFGRKVHAGAEAAKELAKQQEEASIARAEREWAMGKEARDRMRNGVAVPKHFARLADDKELNDHLKKREHWGDPLANLKTDKRDEKTGTYKGRWPQNRYGLAPGSTWDGVDRSNGFEKSFLMRENEKSNAESDRYKWSVEDM